MWLDLPFAQVSRSVEQNVHTTFSFPNPLSESKELQSWGCVKDSVTILDAIRRSFFTKSSSTSSLPSRNREYRLKAFDRFTAPFP